MRRKIQSNWSFWSCSASVLPLLRSAWAASRCSQACQHGAEAAALRGALGRSYHAKDGGKSPGNHSVRERQGSRKGAESGPGQPTRNEQAKEMPAALRCHRWPRSCRWDLTSAPCRSTLLRSSSCGSSSWRSEEGGAGRGRAHTPTCRLGFLFPPGVFWVPMPIRV